MGLFDDLTSDRRPFGFSMASSSRLPSVRRPGGSSKSRPISMIEVPTHTMNAPAVNTSPATPKQNKRRSLLPQFSTRKGSADQSPTEAIQEYDEDERPSTSVHTPAAGNQGRVSNDMVDRKAMPPPSKLGRPMSSYGASGIRPPSSRQQTNTRDPSAIKPPLGREEALKMLSGSSGGAARAHARAQSTTLQRNTSTRVPQSPSAARNHTRQSSIKAPASHSRDNSVASVADKRRPGASGRPASSSVSSTGTRKTSREGSPPSPLRSTANARSQMPPPSRPTFNTYQQHYSPAKSALPKPPVPSSRSTRSPSVASSEGNGTVPSETCWKEQIELLQLSLLHQASVAATKEFEADAKQKLGRKHARLQRDYESVSAMEREQQRMANLTALSAWSPDPELLVENMQVLGRVHSELTSLTQSEGRYDELVSVFEAWMDDADAAFSGSRSGFVENLPDIWRTTHTSLALKLRTLQRDMETLPRVPRGEAEKASIGVLVRNCWEMLEGMLRELEVMSKLERTILEKEKIRVDEDVMFTAEEAVGGAQKPGWIPAWQTVA